MPTRIWLSPPNSKAEVRISVGSGIAVDDKKNLEIIQLSHNPEMCYWLKYPESVDKIA
ncbi:MAG: hypothetical protein OEM28_03505 [Nitrosopumilus sp.]|nr:hypothetical protein [Nitrosopumilus sp.]MDH3488583.1 hypothetical protein [Nitrosopumilus sp.]